MKSSLLSDSNASPGRSENNKESSAVASEAGHTLSIHEGSIKPKVHFSMPAALGIQFSVSGAPLSIGTYLSLTIGLGGLTGYFWCLIFTGFFQAFVCLAVAELASAIPHSSGPAHWVVALSNPRLGRALGYLVGWVTTCAWWGISVSGSLYLSEITLAIVAACQPEYEEKSWHIYLVFIAYALLTLLVNLPRIFKSVNYMLLAAVVLFNGTALYLLVSLLVRATPKTSAHEVFASFINESGWSSDTTVFLLGILPGMATFGALDNATHLTDELENPRKQVPQVIIGSYCLSFVTAVIMVMVYAFCDVDPDSLLDPVGGQPLVQLVVNAERSDCLAVIGISLILICFFIANASALISFSRLYWSFSRTGALPFSGTMSTLSSSDALPVYSMLWTTLLTIALGAICIGSSTAMNAILGGTGLCIATAIVTAFILVLYRGHKTLDPNRWFNLGCTGPFVFVLGTLWTTFACIFLSMPLYQPITPANMNYTSVVFVGFAVLSGLYWLLVFSRRKIIHRQHEDRHCHGEVAGC